MLYVLLSVLLLIVFILSLSIRFHVQYLNNVPAAYVKILCFKLPLYPSKPKKKTKKTKVKKKQRKKTSAPEEKPKQSLGDIRSGVGTVIDIITALLEKFLSSLTVTATRIHISVGSDNAAKTALLYGGICQGVSYLIELLDNVARLKTHKNTYIHVGCDFSSEETVAEIHLVLSMRVYRIIGHGFRVLKLLIKQKIKNESNKFKKDGKQT